MSSRQPIFQFDPDHHELTKSKGFKNLHGLAYEANFIPVCSALFDLMAGDQKSKFADRGYVLMINGPWGAGKTTVTWALINELQATLTANDRKTEVITIDKSVLPFGNASESITAFLNYFAEDLWKQGAVDVRNDIKQFILEVTPEYESKYSVSANFGPLSFTKPFTARPIDIAHDVIKQKFKTKLADKDKVVVVVLDDLDRLRPDEIVDVMRMVEKLRILPRVLVILPAYKEIITNAFSESLKVPGDGAATFLRKLTDLDIVINNDINDLNTVFINEFAKNKTIEKYGLSVAELSWYSLLHNIIVTEAFERVKDNMDGNSVEPVFNGVLSTYLHRFRNLLNSHRNIRNSNDPVFPTHAETDQGNVFVPLGHHYGQLRDMGNVKQAMNQLLESKNVDNVMKLVTKDPDVISEVKANNYITFDEGKEAASSAPVLIEVLIPYLKDSDKEPLLTDNYKLREIKRMAQMIQGDPRFNINSEDLGLLYTITKDSYEKFR
ncbi:hypothetical protein KC951_00245 [Candidatus Saccharibacteria bacterium]|nr:hypothetical protein [Candidatus Saccharibacteria bacterium]